MRTDWVLVYRLNMTADYKYIICTHHDSTKSFHLNQRLIHTGTGEECVALGKMLGCMYRWDFSKFSYKPIEEPPDDA